MARNKSVDWVAVQEYRMSHSNKETQDFFHISERQIQRICNKDKKSNELEILKNSIEKRFFGRNDIIKKALFRFLEEQK